MKKNKGFTLVELLAVIVVLAIILAIAIPSVLNVISNTRYNSFKSNEELFVKTTKTYLASNNNLLPQTLNETSKVFLNDLINNSYMEDIKDPLSNNSCNSIASYVLITNTGVNKYSYKPALVCDNYISVDNFNLISNGDFSSEIYWWWTWSSTLSLSNGILINTATGEYATSTCSTAFLVENTAAKKIYIKASLKATNTMITKIVIEIKEGPILLAENTSSGTELNGFKNNWNNFSRILSVPSTSTTELSVNLGHGYVDALSANGKILQIDNVVVIDLTNIYGAGNEPSINEMNQMINNMRK